MSNATVFDERVLNDIMRRAGSSSVRCLQNARSWEALFHSKEREDECCYACRFTGYVIYQIVFVLIGSFSNYHIQSHTYNQCDCSLGRAGGLPSCVLKQNATKANIPFYGRYFFHILLVVIEVYR
jgi:hypothetical protein